MNYDEKTVRGVREESKDHKKKKTTEMEKRCKRRNKTLRAAKEKNRKKCA